jgi:hypothetical protein
LQAIFVVQVGFNWECAHKVHDNEKPVLAMRREEHAIHQNNCAGGVL